MPAGNDPLISSIGDTTVLKMATVGQALADVPVLGASGRRLGLRTSPVTGVNGHGGVQGYVADGWGEAGVAFSTYHSKLWRQEFSQRLRKHLLLQVGVAGERAMGLYWPSLSYREVPGHGAQTDLTASRLVYRAHERVASTELGRSSTVLLLAN